MIITHRVADDGAKHGGNGSHCQFERHLLDAPEVLPADVVWYDLIEPTRGEDRKVEAVLGIEIPTREEMREIEPSSLLYVENGALHMGARILCRSDTEAPKLTDVSFILAEKALVTVRYEEPRSFHLFASRISKAGACGPQPEAILDGLIESIIDRSAEILRKVGDEVENLSHLVFEARSGEIGVEANFQGTIRKMGRLGDLISHVRESMVSLERMLLFLQNNSRRPTKASGFSAEWRAAVRDVQSIEEHASFLSSKIQFILDAVLGLVSLEQNKIVKIFSVLAVIFMPPTLIASIYGMNFHAGMIELDWAYGYPFAILMMVTSVAATFALFKWKKWL